MGFTRCKPHNYSCVTIDGVDADPCPHCVIDKLTEENARLTAALTAYKEGVEVEVVMIQGGQVDREGNPMHSLLPFPTYFPPEFVGQRVRVVVMKDHPPTCETVA